MLNNLFRILGSHVWAAVVQNWFSTVLGIIGAVALAWPALSDTYLAGRQPSEVHWSLFLAALGSVAWGAVSKFALNWKAITGALMASTPRAQRVVPNKGDSLLK